MEKKTAVITGASSGIGMEFAKSFAKKGYSLVLCARRQERLEELKKKLENQYFVACDIILADLSKKEECFRVFEMIKDRRIHVFINNAGFGECGHFVNTDLEKELMMIHVNVRAVHIFTKLMVRKFEEQRGGYLLNVASSAGLFPAGPYMSAYYATKAYVTSLTRGVAKELSEENSPVYVGALCPGPVDTEFNRVANVEFALPGISVKECVRAALWGMKKRKIIIVPSAIMKICTTGQRLLPEFMQLEILSSQQKKKF